MSGVAASRSSRSRRLRLRLRLPRATARLVRHQGEGFSMISAASLAKSAEGGIRSSAGPVLSIGEPSADAPSRLTLPPATPGRWRRGDWLSGTSREARGRDEAASQLIGNRDENHVVSALTGERGVEILCFGASIPIWCAGLGVGSSARRSAEAAASVEVPSQGVEAAKSVAATVRSTRTSRGGSGVSRQNRAVERNADRSLVVRLIQS